MDYDSETSSLETLGKLSKINSAGLVNSTLNNLWGDFFRHYRHGQYLSANSDLDCIWTILGGEKGIEGENTEGKYLDIEKKLQETGVLKDSLDIRGFGKVEDEQLEKLAKQKIILLEKALYLRRLQNAQGKGTAYHDGEDEDFE